MKTLQIAPLLLVSLSACAGLPLVADGVGTNHHLHDGHDHHDHDGHADDEHDGHDHDGHGGGHDHDVEHAHGGASGHSSPLGTPLVHPFGYEPAFLGKELFVDAVRIRGDDEEEIEFEAELEWAFSDDFGIAIEAPWVRIDEDGKRANSGLGDIAIAPRWVLGSSDTHVLSLNTELSIPSGSERKGIGSGEYAFAPSLSAWVDLGNDFQAGGQVGAEYAFESDDVEFFYSGGLVYVFRHGVHDLTAATLEVTGRTIVRGEDRGRDTAEALIGITHAINHDWAVRLGYRHPIGGPEDIDDALLVGISRHF